jgi:mono/diheme cytochrome c family protein
MRRLQAPAILAAAALLPAAGPPGAASTPAALFDAHCGICHAQNGPGTIALAHRLGRDHGLLRDRRDLNADYVKQVVRNGVGAMPPQTRVDLSDAELDAIAALLAGGAGKRP